MPSKVLVTGANGLLGSNIVKQLNRKGYKVVALLRKGCNRSALQGTDVEIVEGSIHRICHVEKAMAGCSYVIHCAAKTQQFNRLKPYVRTNIQATGNLVVSAQKHHVKRFVYVSTANCFTNGTKENPGSEQKGFMGWLRRSGYAYSKYLAQKMVLDEARHGFPAIVVAPTFLVGPGDANVSSGKLLLHGLRKRFVFYPPGGKSFVDVEYAAEATANALTQGKIGNSYLLAGENLSYREFFSKVKKLYNPQSQLIRLPHVFLSFMGNFTGLFQWALPFPVTFSKTNLRLLCLGNYFSGSKAREQLLMKPTNTDEAIQKAWGWYKEMGYI